MNVTIKLDKKSLLEVESNFRGMENRLIRKELKHIVREGAKMFVKSAKAQAPRLTGTLQRNITEKTRIRRGNIYSLIGAKWLEQKKNPALYIHILETGGKKKPVGDNPFLADSFRQKRKAVESHILKRLKGEVEK
tara:strand:- start:14144 stop:14548 length:405 start_codon:yes stop_codon:yes gene_type:complete